MKLYEATALATKHPTIQKLMTIGKKVKPNFSLDDLAWLCAVMDTEHAHEFDRSYLAGLRYNPPPGFKDNPDMIESYLADIVNDIEFDARHGGYGDMTPEQAVEDWVLEQLKDTR